MCQDKRHLKLKILAVLISVLRWRGVARDGARVPAGDVRNVQRIIMVVVQATVAVECPLWGYSIHRLFLRMRALPPVCIAAGRNMTFVLYPYNDSFMY